FDPRDCDSRDDDRFASDRYQAASHAYDDRDDDLKSADSRFRDRDDDARQLGRGPGNSRQSNDEHSREDARWPDRDREPSDRTFDPREPFARDVNLPRGLEREIV